MELEYGKLSNSAGLMHLIQSERVHELGLLQLLSMPYTEKVTFQSNSKSI